MQHMPAPENMPEPQEEAAFYVRVSGTRQEQQGTSLETQEQACRDWIEKRGYNLKPENAFIEVESAAFMDRAVLEQLLEKVRNKEIAVLVCFDPDRLTRVPRDSINIIHTFLETGVRVEFVHGPSDTSAEGQLIMYVLGFSAQKERLQFLERSMRGKAAAARAGRMPATGGVGLYGYDYDPAKKCRVINEQETTVVRQMFQWAMDYYSTYRIACMLNEANIPSKTGKKWSQSRVKRTLQNIAYTGVQFYGKFRHQKVQGGKKIITEKPISEAILVEGFTPPDHQQRILDHSTRTSGHQAWKVGGQRATLPHDRLHQVRQVRWSCGGGDADPDGSVLPLHQHQAQGGKTRFLRFPLHQGNGTRISGMGHHLTRHQESRNTKQPGSAPGRYRGRGPRTDDAESDPGDHRSQKAAGSAARPASARIH